MPPFLVWTGSRGSEPNPGPAMPRAGCLPAERPEVLVLFPSVYSDPCLCTARWISTYHLLRPTPNPCLPDPSLQPPRQGGGVASGGLRELIPAIARTAVAVGVQGIFMEVHDDPTTSPVDAPTQWPLRNLRSLLVELIAIARATRGRDDLDIDLSPVGEDFDPEAMI